MNRTVLRWRNPSVPQLPRRSVIAALAASCAGVPAVAGAQGLGGMFGRREDDPFARILADVSGLPEAQTNVLATRLPDGESLQIRATFPAAPPDRLAALLLVPDTGVDPARYDVLATALASQGNLVLAPVCHKVETDSPSVREQRRTGETRLILDRLLSVRSVLGAAAERLDPNRIGVIGHGDGAWTALGLIGWGRGLRPDSTYSDGRVSAAVGLLPSAAPPERIDSQAVDRVSGQGLVIGRIETLPTPPADSGLWGVGLAAQSTNFGGLIGAPVRARADDSRRERAALNTAATVAAMYFNWVLMEQSRMGRALAELNGRAVEGLAQPLSVRQA
jgi:hypothetical protein